MSEFTVIAQQKLSTPYTTVTVKHTSPRADLSRTYIYLPPIGEVKYPNKKYLFPATKTGNEIDVREGTILAIYINSAYSRSYKKYHIILVKASKGDEIKTNDYLIKNAKLIREISRDELRKARLGLLNSSYALSSNYTLRNQIAWIILKEITNQKFSIPCERVTEMVKSADYNCLEELTKIIQEILRSKKVTERVRSL